VNPIIAILLGWALAGEEFTIEMLLAAGIIIVGVVLIISNQPAKSSVRKQAVDEAVPSVPLKKIALEE
jgi:drug/metabolite transporter (DMT)-like permease